MKYSTQEHFEKTWYHRIPELVEQSLVESDPEVKRDLLEASYWQLNNDICLVMDEETLKDLVELPCSIPSYDLAATLKAIREHPLGAPPIVRVACLKVAMFQFDLICRTEYHSAENPDWYAQWAKWEICSGLGLMHWSIRTAFFDGGMELELRDGEPYVKISGRTDTYLLHIRVGDVLRQIGRVTHDILNIMLYFFCDLNCWIYLIFSKLELCN